MALKRGYISPIDEDEEDYYSSDNDNYEEQQIDTDDEYALPANGRQTKRLKTYNNNDDLYQNDSSSSNQKSIERLPTRRPNPKISNRNALMARENRRKKKEYLENLEKSVEDTQIENKKLKKILQQKNQRIAKLTQESLYMKSVLANKTEILSLLKTIQGNGTPITSSTKNFVCDENFQCNEITSNKRGSVSPQSTGSMTPSMSSVSGCDNEKNSGTMSGSSKTFSDIDNNLLNDPWFSFTDIFSKAPSSDLNNEQNEDFGWQNFLSDTTFNDVKPANIPDLNEFNDHEILNNQSPVNSEHNYFSNEKEEQDEKEVDKPGICLHISSGKVSLEFCASCHMNSQNAWIEEI